MFQIKVTDETHAIIHALPAACRGYVEYMHNTRPQKVYTPPGYEMEYETHALRRPLAPGLYTVKGVWMNYYQTDPARLTLAITEAILLTSTTPQP